MSAYLVFVLLLMFLQLGAATLAATSGDYKMGGFWLGIAMSNAALVFIR